MDECLPRPPHACDGHALRVARHHRGPHEPASRPFQDRDQGNRKRASGGGRGLLRTLYRAKPDAEAVHSHRALFTLNDVSFTELIPAWFDLNERLGPVVGMLLGERYLGRSFVENRLITAVAAAEGLHRRLLADKTYVPDDQFDALRSDLIKAVPAEHVRWLTDRLWNEPSLTQRLMQLVECLGDDIVEPFMPNRTDGLPS